MNKSGQRKNNSKTDFNNSTLTKPNMLCNKAQNMINLNELNSNNRISSSVKLNAIKSRIKLSYKDYLKIIKEKFVL